MANVTDAAFRRIIAKYGKPDILWTEFVSAEGLLSEGREKLLLDFVYSEAERPIIAQVFGSKPEQLHEVAKLVRSLKFDGVDINMGCPDRGIERSGAGAALIKNPKLAKELIAATIEGAGGLPVSVKTRIGYNKIEIENWIPTLLETNIAALTIHGRTRKEMSKVPAHWDVIGECAKIRDQMKKETIILGNGDVETLEEAEEKVKQYGIDGVMIGRGIFSNIFLFANKKPNIEENLGMALEHATLFEELYYKNERWLKPFDYMKKFFKVYINGFDGAKELRVKLMDTKDAATVKAILDKHRKREAL